MSDFFETWRWTLEQLNRGIEQQITGLSAIKVKWLDEDEVPPGRWTWTNVRKGEIGLCRAIVERWFEEQSVQEATLRLVGMNLHELGRILFSPTRQQLVQAAGDAQSFDKEVHWAYNVLEDQRIVKLMIDWFPDAAPALAAADLMLVSEYAGENPAGQAKLLRGRDHLPWPLREAFEELYLQVYGEQSYDWLCEIIEDYIALRVPDDLDRIVHLAHEFLCLDAASSVDPESVAVQYRRWRQPLAGSSEDVNDVAQVLEDPCQQSVAGADELEASDSISAQQHRNQPGILRVL